MIKICAIDLDGTLFDKNKKISLENQKAIAYAKEKGVKVVIATGRPVNGILEVIKLLNLTNDDYIITYNGAKVLNTSSKECIFEEIIYGKDVKKLYNFAKKFNVNIHAFRSNEELITPKHNPYTDIESKINFIQDQLYDFTKINDYDKFLKMMLVDEKQVLDNAFKNVDDEWKTRYSIVRSCNIFLEFLNKNCDKGKSLERLSKYLNVSMDQTMAIGDAGNDIAMIKKAGVGVAMANSFTDVIQAADYVTSSNDEDGVAKAIYKFI